MDLLFQIFESPSSLRSDCVCVFPTSSVYWLKRPKHHCKRTYRALRDAPLYRDVLKSLDVRLCVALDAIRHENATLTSALWGEGKYGPDSLSTYEIRFLKEILKEIGTMSPPSSDGSVGLDR